MISIGKWQFDDEEAVETFFDEKLFEVKQQLQSKPLLRATVRSRVQLLTELRALEEVLEIAISPVALEIPELNSVSPVRAWSAYASALSVWKLKMFNSASATELLDWIEKGFALHLAYAQSLPELKHLMEGEELPKVGLPENAMQLQEGFRWMETEGMQRWEDLNGLSPEVIREKEVLKNFVLELIRLSLRIQFLEKPQ